MLDNQLNNDQVQERIENYIRRRKKVTRWVMLALNIFMFFLFMALSWGITLATPSLSSMLTETKSPLAALLILPTIGWGLGIFFHLLTALADSGAMDRSYRRRAMIGLMGEQIFANLMAQAGMGQEKTKRESRPLHLGDDGELVSDDEEVSEDSAPQKKMAGKS